MQYGLRLHGYVDHIRTPAELRNPEPPAKALSLTAQDEARLLAQAHIAGADSCLRRPAGLGRAHAQQDLAAPACGPTSLALDAVLEDGLEKT